MVPDRGVYVCVCVSLCLAVWASFLTSWCPNFIIVKWEYNSTTLEGLCKDQ